MNDNLRYPIGKFVLPENISKVQLDEWIDQISALPAKIREAAAGLSDKQLDTPYRPGGWTLRQVIHHLPDSHMNAYIRFKLAYTEDHPTVRPYYEEIWAECGEAKNGPIEVSINLLDALHKRWVFFLKTLNVEDFDRSYQHAEHGESNLKKMLGLYVWHGNHHLNHIINTRKLNKW
ncbi:putative metal-dependent hydrolase [Pedobacter sp. HMF7647]|uniref:Putative metal-dependent hydrolase n=1 Tax=Hufsiella arboris TaxID=2695275 RepID=A0A7K1Y4U6_9SPHI|nr:putative metal-dependent hydrolase [Hufsiella arboris]